MSFAFFVQQCCAFVWDVLSCNLLESVSALYQHGVLILNEVVGTEPALDKVLFAVGTFHIAKLSFELEILHGIQSEVPLQWTQLSFFIDGWFIWFWANWSRLHAPCLVFSMLTQLYGTYWHWGGGLFSLGSYCSILKFILEVYTLWSTIVCLKYQYIYHDHWMVMESMMEMRRK